MLEVSLCRDTVDALYSGGFNHSFAVYQPKEINSAVRGKPYAARQVLIFQEIHPTSVPLREFYVKMV